MADAIKATRDYIQPYIHISKGGKNMVEGKIWLIGLKKDASRACNSLLTLLELAGSSLRVKRGISPLRYQLENAELKYKYYIVSIPIECNQAEELTIFNSEILNLDEILNKNKIIWCAGSFRVCNGTYRTCYYNDKLKHVMWQNKTLNDIDTLMPHKICDYSVLKDLLTY